MQDKKRYEIRKGILIFISIFILISTINIISAARLPIVGGDADGWGTILNEFLNVSYNGSGELRSDIVFSSQIVNGTITDTDISDITNLTLGEKITFTFGEIIDNIVDGWIKITGGLNVTQNFTVGSSALFVDSSSGNVGIGTTNPERKLDVDGIIRAKNNYVGADTGFRVAGTSVIDSLRNLLNIGDINFTGLIYGNGSQLIGLPETADIWVNESGDTMIGNLNISGANLRVENATGSSVFFVNASNRSVGIGTDSPDATLKVEAGSSTIPGLTVKGITGMVNTPIFSVKSSTGGSLFLVKNNGEFIVYGSFGVGASASGNSKNFFVANTYSGSFVPFALKGYNGGGGQTANYFEIMNGSNNMKMVVDSNGNVGIGTATPQNLLNVLGNVNITGTLYAHNISGNSPIIFLNGSGAEAMRVTESGNLNLSKGIILGNYGTKPTCDATHLGMMVFDTTNDKPYVCASSDTWNPLDSDYDSDGIVAWLDNDDTSADDVCSTDDGGWCFVNKSAKSNLDTDLVSGNIKSSINIFGVDGNSNVVDTSGGNIDSTARIRLGYTCYSDGSSYSGSLANCANGGNACYANGGYWASAACGEGGSSCWASGGKWYASECQNIGAEGTCYIDDTTRYVYGEARTLFPATGQATSYETGDDGYWEKGAAKSYTDNVDGTTTDDNTGLMWCDDGNSACAYNGGWRTWSQALTFCNDLTFATHSDWRLPNVYELFSIALMEPTHGAPYVDTAYFTNIAIDRWYVTSTSRSDDPTNYALIVYFQEGSVGGAATKWVEGDVLCVRGESS